MKGKGWWIAGGILLLWISPLFYGIISSVQDGRNDRDYKKRVEAWNRRVEEHLRPKYSEAERLRLKAGYDQAMKEAADRWAETEVRILLSIKESENVRAGSTAMFTSRTEIDYGYPYTGTYQAEPAFLKSQPDLTGVYWTQPLKAGQGAWQNVQINYVDGPN